MVSVSVVVPLYNKAGYVAKCIDSVLAQTHSAFELIVVDDGSTDDSAAIVRDIHDNRATLVSQSNQGVSAARNRGMKQAKHDLVAFLDADDWWHPDYLAEMIAMAEACPNVSLYSAVYAHVENNTISVNSRFTDSASRDVVFDPIAESVRQGTFLLPFSSSSVVLRKAILSQAGLFDPRIAYYEDYDLFLRIGVHSRCAMATGRPLVFYNKDVPPANRATGQLFPIERSLIGHLDKFEPLFGYHEFLKPYIDLFLLHNIMAYVEAGHPPEVIQPLIQHIDRRRLSWKQQLYFSSTPLGFLFIRTNVLRRVLTYKWRRLFTAGRYHNSNANVSS